MNEELVEMFVRELKEKERQWPVRYFPPINESAVYPKDIFADPQTIDLMAKATDLSVEKGREVGLEGNIIDGFYRLSDLVVGKENMILRWRPLSSTEEKSPHPYQAIVFDFHTHPKNLTPSQMDLQGYLFMAGSIQRAIWHLKSEVNPVFIIGRSINGRREMLCYQFLKEELPIPNNRGEKDDFIRGYWDRLCSALHQAQQMSDEIAVERDLNYFVNLMNSCNGIRAFGRTI